MIAALGQAQPEMALLKAVPADVDVAIRIRGVEATRNDLLAMLKAMNPDWAKMAEDGLEKPLAEFQQRHGEPAYKSPWIGLVRVVPPEAEGAMPFAILVPSDEYKGVLKGVSGGKDVELKPQEGGYDAFDAPDGHGTWYAAHRPGVVAFGPDKPLITSISKPAGKTLDQALAPAVAKGFLGGDLGVYVNAAALTTRYADQIEQGRQTFMALLDQAPQLAGNEAMIKFTKDFYGGLFDSVKYADALTIDLDFSDQGLHLAGVLNVKADSEAAKWTATVHTSTAAGLGNFAPGAMIYSYADLEARTFEQLMGMSLRMLNPGGKTTPALEKATAQFHGLGRIEMIGGLSMGNGMRGLYEVLVSDPRKYIEAGQAMLQAMKGGGESPINVYKDVKVEPDAKTYRDFTFTHLLATIDLDKLAQLSGNIPGQAANLKAMFGGETVNYWYGTDGKRVLQAMTPTWDEAKAQIDAYLDGKGGIGTAPGFQAVRSRLPEQASLLVMLSVQEFTRMIASQLATVLQNPNLKVPDDMPKDPAFLGAALTPRPPAGYEFHLVVPSAVGPVVAKGTVPLVQGLRPPGANP
jgi:hypothetical protein